ncbi:GRAM domain-containing protein 4, partial [Geodia barretti]
MFCNQAHACTVICTRMVTSLAPTCSNNFASRRTGDGPGMIRKRVAASLAGRRRRTNSGVPPPPESANRSLPDDNGEGGGGESESFSSDCEEEERGWTGSGDAAGGKKPWERVDQSVYEEQLEKLQEQLVQVMIENQALQAELEEQRKKPGSSQRRELDQLRQENTSLQQRLGQERLRHQTVSTTSSHSSVGSEDGPVEDGYENVTTDRERVLKLRRRKRPLSRRFSYASARESVYNFLYLFSEDARTPSNEPEEEATPLTAKRLKENCTRLGKSSKPWRETASHVKETLRWKSSAESLVVFLIYMYCVWNGWIIQLVLFISVIKLTLNYLYISGLAEQFGFSSGQIEEEADENMGLADKFQLVKQVAQTVQNMSGTTSDTLEKLRNLWLWRQPEATTKLYIALLLFLLVSLFLPNSYTLTFIGLFAGMKLFIVDNIYRKYPRVQEEFDNVDRMWRSLPTDTELLERQTLSREEMVSYIARERGGGIFHITSMQHENRSFVYCMYAALLRGPPTIYTYSL